ncbi:DoxX family membrane protein [Maritimibacter sp. DP07]|jgi:putative oxidoreductase|uniref:DoxX family membrane protein n=2 Tax=Maritimibacter harenae TaxID=2606218 RepID=A0A845LYU3_9RHOB|nr:DoxX family membrane protein [Maritimibacter harenae]
MSMILNFIGRFLIALLFIGGAVQKVMDPTQATEMVTGLGLPAWLVWAAAGFNAVAAVALITGPGVRFWALALAVYCLCTSYFHWDLREDPWQLTIMVKNWAIAGGLLILASQGPGATLGTGRRAASSGFQPDKK